MGSSTVVVINKPWEEKQVSQPQQAGTAKSARPVLILGILGTILAFNPGPSSLLGLVLCSVALYRAFRLHGAQEKLARAGVIVASLGLGLALLMTPLGLGTTAHQTSAEPEVQSNELDNGATAQATEEATTQEPTPSPTASAVPTPSASQRPAPKSLKTQPAKSPQAKPKKAQPRKSVSTGNGSALAAAKNLTVKGRAPKTGYDRAEFGQRWADIDRNGCDQRNDILRRDLKNVVIKNGTRGCVVMSGSFIEPFSGKQRSFLRGPQTSSEIHIDHIVALSDAWQKGAQQWTPEKRTQFGNDFLNLMAVDGRLNQQKGDSDAATWLPPNKSFRCPYVARQVAVKQKYDLWVTAAEQQAMLNVLSGCPEQKLPRSGTIPRDTSAPVSQPAPRPKSQAPVPAPKATVHQPKPQPLIGPPSRGKTDPQFRTCKDAKANGYGPYARGQHPEYEWYTDRDRDGIVCE